MKRLEAPVLIVGAGPVGLACSILLSKHGIANLVVERRGELHQSPQAHVVNSRSMEILRTAIADEDTVRAAGTGDLRHVIWVDRLLQHEFGRIHMMGRPEELDALLAATPCPPANVSQHRFEPILAELVEELPSSQLRFGHQWDGLVQDDEGVTSTLRDLDADELYEVRSRYLLACDGAGSRVRNAVGIDMIGPDAIQTFVMVHFEADLRDALAERPAILYWLMDPDVLGTVIAHDLGSTFVYMRPIAEENPDLSTEAAGELVRSAMGSDAPKFEVRSVARWTMTAQVAERYRSDRVFLVGDAAHRFPPTGGIGMNTGLQDAHNLVWKLCAIERGHASPRLLDSYEVERRGVAQRNTDHSMANAAKLFDVVQALGVSPDRDITLANLAEARADGERRRAAEAAIEAQRDHFIMPGLDLGFHYEQGALVADGTPAPIIENPARELVNTTRPGHRLPHAWLACAEGLRSTLDVLDYDGFALLTGADGGPWLEAAKSQNGPSVDGVQIGAGCAYQDANGAWAKVCELGPADAILVRPDGHVAWRARGAEDAGARLQAALEAVLG